MDIIRSARSSGVKRSWGCDVTPRSSVYPSVYDQTPRSCVSDSAYSTDAERKVFKMPNRGKFNNIHNVVNYYACSTVIIQ